MFSEIKARWLWRPIPNCPGRFVFAAGPTSMAPDEIATHAMATTEHSVISARDPVLVMAFPGGGLISYRKPDGQYLHTLNTCEGFERKLRELGISSSRGVPSSGSSLPRTV